MSCMPTLAGWLHTLNTTHSFGYNCTSFCLAVFSFSAASMLADRLTVERRSAHAARHTQSQHLLDIHALTLLLSLVYNNTCTYWWVLQFLVCLALFLSAMQSRAIRNLLHPLPLSSAAAALTHSPLACGRPSPPPSASPSALGRPSAVPQSRWHPIAQVAPSHQNGMQSTCTQAMGNKPASVILYCKSAYAWGIGTTVLAHIRTYIYRHTTLVHWCTTMRIPVCTWVYWCVHENTSVYMSILVCTWV